MGEAHSGGFWARELKRAGYNGLIIEGKSDKPVYVVIDDGEARIKDASHIWGLGCPETEGLLRKDLGGVRRKDDTLPYRIMHEGLKEGGTLGNTVNPKDLNIMLGEHYAARGWDEDGTPRDETLRDLT